MSHGGQIGQSRRTVVGVAALAALGAVGVSRAGAQRSVGGGIAGGGVVPTGTGDAEFSLFATRLPLPGVDEPTVFGHLRWVDPGWQGEGLTLVSTEVSDYGPPEDDPESQERVVRGTVSANGEGRHPFAVRILDAGPDRFGEDTITLLVGEAATTPTAGTASDFSYSVDNAPVEGGDVELLDFSGIGPG